MKFNVPFFPEQGSEFAKQVDYLYYFLNAVSYVFGIAIFAVVIYFAIRYKRKSEADRPVEVKESNLIEILGSVIPFILVMIMFFWGSILFLKSEVPPANAMEILVTGKQWMWKIQHPNGKREINHLHVPAGVPVKLTMTSEDVIHSFYLPALRMKRDVVPGKYTKMWFQADKVGQSHLFCAEYCGTEHSEMVGSLHVMAPEDYQRWVSGAAATIANATPADIGKQVFLKNACNACHTAGDIKALSDAIKAPNLAGIFGKPQELESGETVVVDENFIRESVKEPLAKVAKGYLPLMAPQPQLTDSDITYLIAFIKSLKAPDAPAN